MLKPSHPLLLAGQWVEVRSAAEIAATLDADGMLDGLPFMPEMVRFCGQRLKVVRRADKTCVEGYGLRRMNSTVLLDLARCDGADHDGCQRNCLIFWKQAWLKPVPGPQTVSATRRPDDAAARRRLQALPTRRGELYACQSTALGAATTPLPRWSLAHLVLDVLRGELTLPGLLLMTTRAGINRARRQFGLRDIGALAGAGGGPRKSGLELKSGELVRIKSAQEITRTLGPNSKTRGLSFEPEMSRYIGGTFEVEFPVERIILEETGRMVQLTDTVALKGLACLGSCVKNCPRGNTLYWREAWLERAGPERASGHTDRAARRGRRPSRRPDEIVATPQQRPGRRSRGLTIG